MGAIENVFGHDVKVDAQGQPVERGFGNLTDRGAKAKAESLGRQIALDELRLKEKIVAENAIAAAKAEVEKIKAAALAEAEKIVADANAEAANVKASAVAAAALATVPDVVGPKVVAEPPAAATPIQQTVLDRVHEAIVAGEAALEKTVEELVKDL